MKLLRPSQIISLSLSLLAALCWWSLSPSRVGPELAQPSQKGTAPAPQTILHEPQIQIGEATTTLEPAVEFASWTQRYIAAPIEKRGALISEGVKLARERRPVFRELIQTNPEQALREAVPMVVRQSLPHQVVAMLEERVNRRGAIRVYQGVGLDNSGPVPTHRIAELENGKTYQAHVYGRRTESVLWVPNASVNGVAIENDLAVNEQPARVLEVGERPDLSLLAVAICPVSGKNSIPEEDKGETITEATPALEAYGEIIYLCDGSHTMIHQQTLIYGEGASGGAMTFTGILPAVPTPSIGNIKVLVIPMTFQDQNDTPSTESALYNMMRNVGDHYAKASYGKLTLTTTVTPGVTLPHSEAWYIQKDSSNGGPIDGLGLEHAHARAEVRKLGFDDDEYDCVVVRLKGGARPAGGWGGGKSVWIYGDDVSVTAHEIGHVFGLAHANYWDTAGTSAIGVGANGEYGGYYDVMGGVGVPTGHYNAQGKNQIRWLPNDFVTETTMSGLYRIFAQDQAVLDPGKRFALKIRKDNLRTYWGELRGLYTGNTTDTWADKGLILGWKYPTGGGSNIQLIDTTPGSAFGKTDSPISLGRTFSDTDAGIHMTTVAVNAATASSPKSVDVQVHFGDFAGNNAPTLSLAASSNVVPTNVPVTFTATAADADSDALAYSWQHFGDTSYRTIHPNAPVITRTFPTSGTYVVTCTVSDMKGGSATRSQVITVGSGGGKFNVSGRVTFAGQGLAEVIVNANGVNGVETDSDGYYTIPNLAVGTYIMTPLRYGYTFGELFNNSVTVGPNFSGANFEADSTPRVTLTASVPVCAEGSATPGKFLITRTGDPSQALVMNVTPFGGDAIAADYTANPVPAAGSQGRFTVTIPANDTQLELIITPADDAAAEGPEMLSLSLVAADGYLIAGAGTAVVTINDNDTALPKVSTVVGEAKTIEGTGTPATITVSRTGATTAALAVNYSIGGSATNGTDYTTLSGTVSIPIGASSAVVAVSSLNDAASETLETITLQTTANAAYVIDPSAASATVSLVDDDLQILTVAATDDVAMEKDLAIPGTAADTATFLISRAGDTALPLTVYYAVAGSISGGMATALHGVDYEALPGVLIIPAGQSSAAVTIIPRWDGIGEAGESVTLQLGAGPTNYQLGVANTASITIQDAGDPPYVEVIGVDNAVEGGTLGRFRFSLKGSSATAVTVNYTISGTATSVTDFAALSGTVSIPGNGINTVEVVVTAVNDTEAEDLETVILTITPSASYGIYAPSSSAMIQLRDDEQPTVYADASSSNYPPSFAENSTGGVFYLSRTGSTASSLDVNYTVSGTAVNGTDYAMVSGTATIAVGAQGVEIQITPTNDTIAEGVETVTLTLTAGAYGRGTLATFYITDNEVPAVSVQFSTPSTAALESAGALNIPVSLNATSGAPVTVEYLVDRSTHDTVSTTGTAPPPLPYWVRTSLVGGVVTSFISPDGVAWTTVGTQTITLNTASYMAGMFVCSYNTSSVSTATFDNVSVTGLSVGGTQGAFTGAEVGTTAPAGSSSVAGSVYTVNGGGDNVTGTTDQGRFAYWPITNSANCTITARVISQTNTNASATAGVMVRQSTANNIVRAYTNATPSTGFEFHYRTAAATAEAKVTLIPPTNVWVRLQRTGGNVSAFQSGDGTIWTQIGSTIPLAMGVEVSAGLAMSSGAEGTLATAQLDNVTLSPGPLGSLEGRTVGLSATQGTGIEAGGVYSFAASGDGFNGTGDDGFFLTHPVAGDFTITARILSSTGPSTTQAGLMLRQTLDRRARMAFVGGRAGVAPSFVWRHTGTGTALGTGIDFTFASGMLTFAPGSTLENIPLTIVNDNLAEQDETITITLRNANGAVLGTAQHAIAISDDDTPPPLAFVGFAAALSTVLENAGAVQVPIVLSVAPAASVSVDYALTAGTADAADFTVATGTLTFAAGQTVAYVPVAITDDAIIEVAENLNITLSAPVSCALGSLSAHVLTITDDDSAIITVTSASPTAAEGGATATATFTRTGPTTSALTVTYSRIGTATVTTDYTGTTGSVTIPIGAASANVVLTPVQDTTSEGTETAIFTVTAGAGYVAGTPSAVPLSILDDDRNTVTVTASTPTAVEGGASGQLTVSRTGSTTASLTVSLTVTGTATNVTDYATTPASITSFVLSAGQASRTIPIAPVNDALVEGTEVMTVQINAGSYDIAGEGYATITLLDNDVPPTIFVSSPGAQGVVVSPANGLRLVATMTDDNLPQVATATWSKVAGPGAVTISPATSTDGISNATFSAPGTYLLRVTAYDGQFTVSDQITVNVGGTTALMPSDWISADMGPATYRGFSGSTDGTWVLTGAGSGYATTSDRAHTVARPVVGNGTIVARLTSLNTNGQTAAEAGITIRDTMHRNARRAALEWSASGQTLRFRTRTTSSTADTSVSVTGLALPLWLKLERDAATDTITASYATIEGAWIAIGTPSVIAMDDGADYSLSCNSGSDTVPSSAVFDNVALTPAAAGTAVLLEDFGSGTQTGIYAYDLATNKHTLSGQPGGLDSAAIFRGEQVSGDFILTVLQLDATSNADSAYSGVMIRDSMDNGSMAFVGRNPFGAYSSFVWRTNSTGSTGGLNGITQKTRWLRLVRRGNQVTALHAPNNAGVPGTWAQLGQPQSVFMTPSVMAGLAVCNGAGVGLNVAQFTSLSIVPLNTAPIVDTGVLPGTITSPLALTGSVLDDGLPDPFTATWSAFTGTVTFANAAAPSTSATFSAIGNYALRLTATDGIATTFDDLPFTYTTPFGTWQTANFVGGSTNPDAAPLLDPDNDDIVNLIEYATGTNPNASSANPAIVSKVNISGADYIRVTITKNPTATEVTTTVQSSTTLDAGSWGTTGFIIESETNTGITVRETTPIGATQKRFYRASVVQP